MRKLKRNLDAVLIALFLAMLGLGSPIFLWAATQIGTNQIKNAAITNIKVAPGIGADKIGADTSVSDTEYKTLDGVTSGIQVQLNGKAPSLSGTAGKMTMWTGTSAIGDASNTDTEVGSAVSLKHTQGTDQGLNTGGANEVTVANAKDAVTKKHAHTGTVNYIPKWNGTSYIDGTMVDSGGIIGIAKTLSSPATWYPFIRFIQTTSNSDSRSAIEWYSTNDAYIMAQIGAEPGIAYDNPKFYFRVSDTTHTLLDRMVIDSNGNVGIGTTTSLSRLTVKLSDAAGADSLVVQDSDGVNVAGIDSDGRIKSLIAGGGLFLKEGSNCTMGDTDLVSGTKTINTAKVTANSRIFLTTQSTGGVTPGHHWISTRTAATSFVIQSSVATDTSNVSWVLVEPN